MSLKNILIGIVILFIGSASIALAQDKDDAFSKLKERFDKIGTLKIIAVSQMNKDTLELSISKGNKYQIKMQNRILTSDGTTLWNYSIIDKNVMISNFESFDEGLSIENMFFEKINTLKAISLKSGNDSRLGKYKKLELTDNKNSETIILFLDNKSEIMALEIHSKMGSDTWEILKFITKKSETNYNFTPPSSAEIIDLR